MVVDVSILVFTVVMLLLISVPILLLSFLMGEFFEEDNKDFNDIFKLKFLFFSRKFKPLVIVNIILIMFVISVFGVFLLEKLTF